jgi:peptidoglycan/LPS O-acetylase OafA/YrhL
MQGDRLRRGEFVNRILRSMTMTLVVLALAFSAALLAKDAGMSHIPQMPRGAISAMPLLLVGVAFLILQLMIRPRPKECLKNLLLAATFILWGIVQLMPQNALSMRLGNLVVALYVVDLAWTTLLGVSTTQESMPAGARAADCCTSRQIADERAQPR